jgi:hypothetical protein
LAKVGFTAGNVTKVGGFGRGKGKGKEHMGIGNGQFVISDQFDVYQSILVHSCFMESPGNVDDSSGGQMLIDQNGFVSCSPGLLAFG